MIFVNFKIYQQTFGKGAIELAKICQEVAKKSKVKIVPVVSALDAFRIKNELGIEVYLQQVDNVGEGAKTGYISALQAKELGISGSIINHSERKLIPGTILGLVKHWPKDFKSLLCINSLGQTETWAKNIKVDMIAYEPSYLIGNKEKSVATEKPEVIREIVKRYAPIPLIVGAGIRTVEDVKESLKLGAKGILISSAIITASDPKAELLKLVGPFSV